MAATLSLTPAQIELANSLTQDEIPTRLRCAVCSQLAIHASRLPCCETAICENCQSTLASSCPVCEHSPVSGNDCTVYKSLRTTIKVFLKTEEKKREAAIPKKSPPPGPPTPTETTAIPGQPQGANEQPRVNVPAPEKEGVEASTEQADNVPTSAEENGQTAAKPDDDAQPRQDPSTADAQNDEDQLEDKQDQAVPTRGEAGAVQVGAGEADAVNEDTLGKDPSARTAMGFGFDSMNGNFGGMNFANGDVNQMQMMMAMQNGMNPAAFGSFPMMGMSMGMDPMTMQTMFMNGGFGAQGMGMGMNGMNMNMGMNGFNGGGNDWNGQQSWNVGQDNFNPNAPGVGNGDFGNFNPNFRTGYNAGKYGHQSQYQLRAGYGFRARGRGRGFYGGFRVGHQQSDHHNPNGNWPEQRSQPLAPGIGGAMTNDHEGTNEKKASGKVDEFGRMVRRDSDQVGAVGDHTAEDAEAGHKHLGDSEAKAAGNDDLPASHEALDQVAAQDAPQNGEAHDEPSKPNGDALAADIDSRPRGPSGTVGPVPTSTTAVPDVPLNAPTGPKAMRQGLPNTSYHHLRARGLVPDQENAVSGTPAAAVASPEKERPLPAAAGSDQTHQQPKDDKSTVEMPRGRDGKDRPPRSYSNSGSRSRSRTRSRSRGRRASRRHGRHRSESVSDDSREDESQRYRYRSRKRSTRPDYHRGRSEDEFKYDRYDDRARSASPDGREYKRSSRRNRRARARDRDREEMEQRHRDRDDARDTDHDHRRRRAGRRSRRSRAHERERDREREKDRDKVRERERMRDRDRERDRGHDKDYPPGSPKNSVPATPPGGPEKDFNPPTGPRSSIAIKGASNKNLEIKGASSRPPSQTRRRGGRSSRRASQSSAPTGLGKDAHTSEREARDRERLLKEAQRIAGLNNLAGKKRGRDAADDRSGRRKSRRSEAVSVDEEEERMRRFEAEREGGRWG